MEARSEYDRNEQGPDILRPYASNFLYNAAGAVTAMRLGNGCWTGIDVACVRCRFDAARARIVREDEFQAVCNNVADDHTARKATKQARPRSFRNFQNAKTDDKQADVVARVGENYRNIRSRGFDTNPRFDSSSGYKPGQLVRPTKDNGYFFGRIRTVFERKR